MRVRIGTLSKENNSTLQPTATQLQDFHSFTCQLKAPCSVLNPSIIIDTAHLDLTANYAILYWTDMNHPDTTQTTDVIAKYYFITDIVIDTGNRTTLVMYEDVLATWRSYIMQSTMYVDRSSYTGWYSDLLKDDLVTHTYATYTDITPLRHYLKASESWDNPIVDDTVDGTIIFTTAGGGGSNDHQIGKYMGATGAVYCTTVDGFQRLLAQANNKSSGLLNSLFGSGSGVSTDSQALACAFFSPSQYITNAVWYPVDLVLGSSSTPTYDTYTIKGRRTDTIAVGGVEWTHGIATDGSSDIGICVTPSMELEWYFCASTATDADIVEYKKKFGGILEHFTRCSGWKLDDWIDRADDWNQYSLYVPSIGMMTLPTDLAGQAMGINLAVDCLTGESICKIFDGQNSIHAWQKGQFGITLQLNALTTNISSQLAYDNASASAKLTQMTGSATVGYTQTSGEINTAVQAGNTAGNAISGISAKNPLGMIGNGISGLANTAGAMAQMNADVGYQSSLANINNISASNSVALARATMQYDRMSPSLNVVGAYSSKCEIIKNNAPLMICKKKKRYADLTERLGKPVCRIKDLTEVTYVTPTQQTEYGIKMRGMEVNYLINGALGPNIRNYNGQSWVEGSTDATTKFYDNLVQTFPSGGHVDATNVPYRTIIAPVTAGDTYRVYCQNDQDICGLCILEVTDPNDTWGWNSGSTNTYRYVAPTRVSSLNEWKLYEITIPQPNTAGNSMVLLISDYNENGVWLSFYQTVEQVWKNEKIYIKTADDNIDIPCMDVEKQKVIEMMNGGFYYE